MLEVFGGSKIKNN